MRRRGKSQRNRRGGCKSRKIRYPDRSSAKVAMGKVRYQQDKGLQRQKAPVRYYECEWCSGWHLTSKRR